MTVPTTYWRNYPVPFYSDWKSEPVPGWGVKPVMAGPARVGVGALKSGGFTGALQAECAAFYAASPARQAQLVGICQKIGAPIPQEWQQEQQQPPPGGAGPFPWVLVGAGVLALGGLGAIAYNMGWLGGKKR